MAFPNKFARHFNRTNYPHSASVAHTKISFIIFLSVGDFAAVLAIPCVSSLLRQSTENLPRNVEFWTILAGITVMLIASHGGYRRNQFAFDRKQQLIPVNCFLATSIAMLLIAVVLGHGHILARRWTAAVLILTPFLMIGVRRLAACQLTRSLTVRATNGPLIICYDHCSSELIEALHAQQMSSCASGLLYLSEQKSPHMPGWPIVPNISVLLKMMRDQNIKDVVFVQHTEFGIITTAMWQTLLVELLSYPARIWLAVDVPNLPHIMQARSSPYRIVPLITNDLVNSLNLAKRIVDLVGAFFLLIVISPLLLVCACLVKASGAGPVVFKQTRVGAHGHRFTVLKFRTMDVTSDRFSQAGRNDPRVTKIGRFLRRSSLDETLQIFNVIRGDMSLVGPRPHAPETQVEGIDFENAVKLYRLRLRVKPGITGLAQIRGHRGETQMVSMLEQRVASDLEYIETWSLWLDFAIMFQTLPVMIAQTNAY